MSEQLKNMGGLGTSEIREGIFRLAHFDPTCKDDCGNLILDYLVLDTLATYGQLTVTALTIKENIKRCFRLDFEEAEINASGKRLGQKGMIIYKVGKRFERPTLQILPETEQKITANLGKIQEIENEVIEEWKEDLSNKYRDFPIVKDNIEPIVEDLKLFTSRMFTRHGVECVALLYPEKKKTQEWLESIGSIILGGLPKIDTFLDAIIKLEIPSFFKNPDYKRKIYITSLSNSSFFWHLLQVDEKCSRLLREVTKGQILYIDSNILYCLVGLDGANLLQSVHTMLKLAGALGYELCITSKSIDEFHGSLNWQMKELKRKPPLPCELARIAVENLEEDSFLTLYWRDFVEKGTSIEEFVTEKSYLKDILQGLNIKTADTFREEIEGSQELLDEEAILRSICRTEFNEHIIEHDAFHRIFINKIRKEPKYHFSEAVAWFLTHDSKLPEYDRVARKGSSYLPFCVTSDQWVQINRPLLTRTANQEEYEESFHILVTQPFLRTMIPTFTLEKAYNEVLGRLARYKNMNPQLALNLVTDKHFMVAMASETDEQRIDEKIENRFVDLATQLQSEKQTLENDIRYEKEDINRLEEKINNVEEILEETQMRNQKQIEEIGKKLENEKRDREKAEKESEKIKKEFQQFKTNMVRWVIFVCGLALASLFIWLHHHWLDWLWLHTHKNETLIKLASQLLLVFAFLNIPLKKHWKTWLGLIVVIALGILKLSSL